jgi:hypothetical protein
VILIYYSFQFYITHLSHAFVPIIGSLRISYLFSQSKISRRAWDIIDINVIDSIARAVAFIETARYSQQRIDVRNCTGDLIKFRYCNPRRGNPSKRWWHFTFIKKHVWHNAMTFLRNILTLIFFILYSRHQCRNFPFPFSRFFYRADNNF